MVVKRVVFGYVGEMRNALQIDFVCLIVLHAEGVLTGWW